MAQAVFILQHSPISLRQLKQGICEVHVFHVWYTRHYDGGGVEFLLYRLARRAHARRDSIVQQLQGDAEAILSPASEYCY